MCVCWAPTFNFIAFLWFFPACAYHQDLLGDASVLLLKRESHVSIITLLHAATVLVVHTSDMQHFVQPLFQETS